MARRTNRVAGILLGVAVLAGCGRSPAPATSDVPRAADASAPASTPTPPPSAADPGTAEGLLLAKPWTGDLDGLLERRYIRVLVIPDKMNFFFDGTQIKGVTYDAMREFEAFLNKKFNRTTSPVGFIFVPVQRGEILQALAGGRGDIAAAGLAVSPERNAIVDFSDPVRDRIKVIPVGGPGAPPITSVDDLAGKTVYVPRASVLPDLVASLNKGLRAAGRPAIVVQPSDENLQPTDILEMVNAGLVPLTLSDSLTAEFWAKVFPDLHPYSNVPLTDSGAMAWALRKNSPKLKALVNEFIKDHREGTAFGNTLLRNYLGSTKWAKNAIAGSELQKFQKMVGLFRKYGAQHDLPYLLVAAQAFQESGLNQDARSPVGAVGVMQIKPSTAAGKPIEVQRVDQLENNVKAGTKYLRFLVDRYYADEPMDRVTKGLFAVASYNAGPARIQQLRRKARDQGLDPNRWFNNVELVAAKDIGRETVQYVANIYKYYLAYKMVTEHPVVKARSTLATDEGGGKGR